VVAVPPPLVAALRLHRAARLAERMAAGPAWQDNDLVWCQANGRPISPRADWGEWKAMLEASTSAMRGFMMPGTPLPPCCWLRASTSAW